MNCASCDSAPVSVLCEAGVLCQDCLLHLARLRRRYRCAAPDCPRKTGLLAGPDRICEWCRMGRQVSVNVTTEIHPVTILRGAKYLALRGEACKDRENEEAEKMEDDLTEGDDDS